MQHICDHFQLDGPVVSSTVISGGHINGTWGVTTAAGTTYILQRINHHIFQNVDGLMRNVQAVTAHLSAQAHNPRRAMQLIPAVDGAPFAWVDGQAWRIYTYVERSICLPRAESAEDLKASGVAFGRFQCDLADFPAETLVETLPHFHDTVDRFRLFHEAIEADRAGRLASVQADVDRYLAHEHEADALLKLPLPLRVTHNDTKLTNVLLDEETREPLCVIDLDTVMPGLAANDFGDAIRFGASTAAEDEKNLSKVRMDINLYRAFTEGFLSGCGHRLTALEKQTLPLGAKLMTLECGVRFLTDYLNGDTYFAVHYEGQNLDRARTQITLVESMEAQWADMAITE